VSQFEYVAIPVSLIVTFSLARLLSGFPYLLTSRRTYWVQTLWCITAIVNLLFHWWAFWNASEVEDWTLGGYLLALAYPGLCYIGAMVLVPTGACAETDWHSYFFGIRRLWFSVAAIATLVNVATAVMIGPLPLLSLGSLLGVGITAVYVVGFLVAMERAQKIIVVLNAVFVVAAYAPLINQPIGS
jgi:hypothetical protein